MNLAEGELAAHFSEVTNFRNSSIREGLYQPQILGQLGEVLRKIEPEQAYLDCLDQVRREFCAELLVSDEFYRMLRDWPELDPETQQKPYLQKCVNRLARLFELGAGIYVSEGQVSFYHDEDPRASDAVVAFNCDKISRDMDDILLNSARSGPRQNLLLALQSVGHEQTHLFNLSLNTAYGTKGILSGHPLFGEARYFHEHFRHDAYISCSYGAEAPPLSNPYLLQLDERAAFRVGDSIHEHLLRGVSRPRPAHGTVAASEYAWHLN